MMPSAILELSARQLAGLIRARVVTARQAMEAVLERAAAVQPALNCFMRVDAEPALQMAHEADLDIARGRVRGPLHGVPMAHKDMFDRTGVAPSRGSRVKNEHPPERTATVLRRLDEAGALQFGVLAMAEFAYGPTGHNAHFGACGNPWDPSRISGGSSSGAAASLGARANFAALGSDTGGSIRIPAAICGTAGIKPTYGRVSRAGAMALSHSVDTVGPLARTVEDCALILQAIAGADPADASCSSEPAPDYLAAVDAAQGGTLRGLRIGISPDYFMEGIDPSIASAMHAALDMFRRLGAQVVIVRLPAEFAAWHEPTTAVIASEAAALHARSLCEHAGDYSPQVAARLANGFGIPAQAYHDALRFRSRAIAEFASCVFSQVDVFHAPTVGVATPTIEASDAGASSAMAATIASMTRLTRLFNFLGLPSLALQAGFTQGGLPIGMQLVGRPFDEARLFACGHAYQSATQWHLASPPPFALQEP